MTRDSRTNRFRSFVVAVIMACAFSSANATLINDTVSCAGIFGFVCSSPTAVVGAGIEFTVSAPNPRSFDVDIGASSILLTNIQGGFMSTTWNMTLSGLDWVGVPGQITGIANFFTNANSGIVASDITTGIDSVFIDLDNSDWTPGQILSFDLLTVHVPEPGTLTLFGLGLAGLGFQRRKAE